MPKAKPPAAELAPPAAFDVVYMQVRIRRTIREALKELAHDQRRSLNAAIVVLLEQGLAEAKIVQRSTGQHVELGGIGRLRRPALKVRKPRKPVGKVRKSAAIEARL